MEIILNQDVDKIGKAGSVVKVKDGFARNFLIPNGMALPLTSSNLKKLEAEKQKKLQQAEKAMQASIELKSRLESLSLTIAVLTQEEEKLYASVTSQNISSALKEEGFEIDKECILLDEPIKALGIFEVTVELRPEVSAKLKLWVVKK